MFKVLARVCLIVIFLLSVTISYSQDILKGTDLSTAKVDRLTDADILKYQAQLKSSGLTQEQAEQIALSKGFPAAELAKLRQRLAALSSANTSVTTPKSNKSVTRTQDTTDEAATRVPVVVNPRVFGAELFTTSSLTFQPDLKIATPMNYVLGPDDELAIAVSGLQEAAFNLPISPEGTIYIPNVGPVKVSGLTFEGATTLIRNRMSGIYSSLRSGSSRLSVSLSRIRSIRVTILGAAKPGTYTISSLSTLFNALYIAGGPAADGTFRAIELVRNNKVERVVDLYSFLLTGNDEDNVRLRENDVIRIPVYKTRVDISGQVKQNGIFEMLPSETLNDLLGYASGFTDNAYKASIKVVQLTDRDKRVKDIPGAEFSTYKPSTGDVFNVSQILEKYQNRVTINGAVFRPGVFELTDNLTIGNLIRRADGLREDAYIKRGQIIRLREDLTPEIISFDVSAVLNNVSDISLKKEDVINISSIFDLKDNYTVSIQGEVRAPGDFRYVENISLKDLIQQAGGFTYAAFPQRIQIARVIKRDTLTAQDVRLSEIIDIQDMNDLSFATKNIQLQPYDVVTVRRLPGYLDLRSVTVRGQVQFPGPYVLSTRRERISDLLKRAGGMAPEAFPDGAYLKRLNENDVTTQIESAKVERIQQQLKDSSGQIAAAVARPFDQIPLDLSKIMRNPGRDDDLILKAGDDLFVPRNDEGVKISGEVLFPTQAPYNNGKRLKEYISDAGGFTQNAIKKKVYVLYPNGKAVSTRHFLFVKSYPRIKPGSQIVVPKYITREKQSTAEIIGITSAIAGLAAIILGIIQLTK
ncbi:MAG: SLBB domain-containing protein [Chitinophagaceae bacterium]